MNDIAAFLVFPALHSPNSGLICSVLNPAAVIG
jgi:hypothetical protein